MKFTSTVAAAGLAMAATASAYEITFPDSGSVAYWVTCQNNPLKWTYGANDPEIFSVALLNSNQQQLIGNYQVANSLNKTVGEATIPLSCVPSGTYSLLFVNASQYALNNPEVYKESSTFTIKPNGTDAATATSVSTGSVAGSAPTSYSSLNGALSSSSGASIISGSAAASSSNAPQQGSNASSQSGAKSVLAPAAAAFMAVGVAGAGLLL